MGWSLSSSNGKASHEVDELDASAGAEDKFKGLSDDSLTIIWERNGEESLQLVSDFEDCIRQMQDSGQDVPENMQLNYDTILNAVQHRIK